MTEQKEFNFAGINNNNFTNHLGMKTAYNENNMTIGVIAPFKGFDGPVP